MNDDDIIIQPGNTAKSDDPDQDELPPAAPVEDEKNSSGTVGEAILDAAASDDSNEPKVFDFSSDFTISPVADAPAAPTPLAKSLKSDIPVPPKAEPAPQPIPSINKLEEKKPGTAAPSVSEYRETVDNAQKWPFAFGKGGTDQPIMNPSATAAGNAAPSAGKNSPSSQPVKTIKSEGGEQSKEKDSPRPATNLQRDIFAILPNMDEKKAAASPMAKNPLFEASKNSDLKPLRTYEGDVAEVLSHRNISSASIAIAENKKKTGLSWLGGKKKPKEEAPAPDAEEASAPVKIREVERDIEPGPAPEPKPQLTNAEERTQAFRPAPVSAGPTPEEAGFKGGITAPEEASAMPSEPAAPSHFVRNLLYIILSLILVGGGLYGGYYLYAQSPLSSALSAHPAAPAASTSFKSLIPADTQVLIASEGQSPQNLAARIQAEIAKPQNPNTIKEIMLTQAASGIQQQATPADISRMMNIPVPNIILRTLQPAWMLGVYADSLGAKSVFIAARTDTFQNAFSGMLQWEPLMPSDLNAYLNAGTTTPLQGSFIDEIVRNRDVRAFVSPGSEKTVFLYSFIDNSMIVMADSEIALSEIVTRLENQAFVR